MPPLAPQAPDVQATSAAVTFREVSKTFPGTKALDRVGFSVQEGQVHGLVGGNGSGKSTLIKLLAGVQSGDAGGTVTVGAKTVKADGLSAALARSLGLRFVHQNPGVFPRLTVAENIAVGNEFPTRWGAVRWRHLRARTRDLLERFEVKARPDDSMADLRPAEQTMVAIARALQDEKEGEMSTLVLDEPTASLPESEVRLLLDAVRGYARHGRTIILVSHHLDEVLGIADSVTVLRDGRHVATRPALGLGRDELIELIIGRSLEKAYPDRPEASRGGIVLDVSGLRAGPLRDVSFQVRGGEIVGIAGLLGSGRTELLRSIFGAHQLEGGELRINGELATISTPAEAMNLGIAYVPENREEDAALPHLSVRENLSVADLPKYWKHGRLDRGREAKDAEQAVAEFGIRTSGAGQLLSALSGGNQQKVMLARWLRRRPQLLLLDEPSQGVDIGARADLYGLIRAAVDAGAAAVIVSSDLEELLHGADRILVLCGGVICANRPAASLDEALLTHLMYGGDHHHEDN